MDQGSAGSPFLVCYPSSKMVYSFKYQCVGCRWQVRLSEELVGSGVVHGMTEGPEDWEVDIAVQHNSIHLSRGRALYISTVTGHSIIISKMQDRQC